MWIKLWKLKLQDPNKYSWLIPVPGEWHWTWHITKGMFKMYHESIFQPFGEMLGYKYVDAEATYFHYSEDLLEMVRCLCQKQFMFI